MLYIYSKAAIWAQKKCSQVWQSTQDGQGEKVVQSRWQPRNGCDGRSMVKILATIQVNFIYLLAKALQHSAEGL